MGGLLGVRVMSPATEPEPPDEPVARCDGCGRLSWDPGMIGLTCFRPCPPNMPCTGVLRALDPTEVHP